MTGAHQSSKKQKYFRACFGTCNEENAFFLKRAKMCSKAFLLFARLMCGSRIFNKRKHVLAEALLPKAALLDWSAPGLTVNKMSSAYAMHCFNLVLIFPLHTRFRIHYISYSRTWFFKFMLGNSCMLQTFFFFYIRQAYHLSRRHFFCIEYNHYYFMNGLHAAQQNSF